jgi:phage terminase large subunit-like protein
LRASLAGLPTAEIEAFLDGLSPNALASLPWLFEHWALEGHQLPPEGDWLTWVILGGRGAGKTRAGSEWIRAQVEGAKPLDPGACSRVALLGETLDEAREVMIFGESGILRCSPPDRRPVWNASRRQLAWPNGAVAQVFSASDPEALRGPQFDCAWSDELAKWKKTAAAWDMLQFGLRLGHRPRQVVTTTPRDNPVLREILAAEGTVRTHATTAANRANLAASFLDAVTRRYAGSPLGRQELDGELLSHVEGALWPWATISLAQGLPPFQHDRIVVAVDPPVTGGDRADACGIIVAGVSLKGLPNEWRAEVIADATVRGLSPHGWAQAAADAYRAHRADRMVVEVNQGGDLVPAVMGQVAPDIPVRKVNASRGKILRAEPVAALYEQGRVRHAPGLEALEAQMAAMSISGFAGRGSPDRVDALVWAITELILEPAQDYRNPRVRGL